MYGECFAQASGGLRRASDGPQAEGRSPAEPLRGSSVAEDQRCDRPCRFLAVQRLGDGIPGALAHTHAAAGVRLEVPCPVRVGIARGDEETSVGLVHEPDRDRDLAPGDASPGHDPDHLAPFGQLLADLVGGSLGVFHAHIIAPMPADLELCHLPATEALRRFRARTLSPVELMTAIITRAEAVDGAVNALVVRHFERAMGQAREAEARYMGHGPEPRPLEGLPVGIKDEVPIEGDPCSGGSLVTKDDIADHSAPIAERILAAGGIVHARTATPEFSTAGFTHSRLWGVTVTPWNPGYSSGGSSGGSAAALASGTATLASGSDIGGSIRIPAAFCGVVGFKPPFGRVPVDPPFNLDQYCHDGPMARTVADAALLENVIAGPHRNDIVSLRPKVILPDHLEGIRGLRVGLSVNLGDYPIDPDVERETRAAAAALRDAGATVVEVDPGLSHLEVTELMLAHFGLLWADGLAKVVVAHPDLVTPYLVALVRRGQEALSRVGAYGGLEREAAVQARILAVLETVDVMICPTTSVAGLPAGDDLADGPFISPAGRLHDYFFDWSLTPPFNIASRCPVLAVPSGMSDAGVPTGLQIVGRTYDDETVFRVGAALERERPWLDVPARRPVLPALPVLPVLPVLPALPA
ncbi:MAG: amidase [Chloroflexi bacterium]|nr:amidase [Chloroflexota bacterium]